ncbi:unnamed protein product [Onchocerca flexuosa]|uniref:WW domain-containing protein n=1 Tax=Onchocerca flexuosa TaxID=387005 RepID=A0A183H9B5_9BILA|nr:unnamed protein product [Onchocerca flexuosa]
MTGIIRTNPSNCSTCDASSPMADIPEDVKLEQLLKLREQLREQIDQLNADSPLESSNSMRKISKYRHLDGCQTKATKKVEKRPNSCTVDGCANSKITKISLQSRMEDGKNEQPGCSGMTKKPNDTWVLDNPVTSLQNLHHCPFRNKSDQLSDITGTENGPKKLGLHSEMDEIAPIEVSKAGNFCATRTDDMPIEEKMEEISLSTLIGSVGNEVGKDEADNTISVQLENAIPAKNIEASFATVFGKLVPLPPPPPPPPTTPPKVVIPSPPPPPPLRPFSSVNETNSANDENALLEQQQSEKTEERSRSLSRPAEDSGSELNGIDGRSNKDGKDIFLSDEDDGEDIDLLLEKPVEDAQTGKVIMPEDGEVREKIVLAYRGTDYFDVLPEGWVEVTHSSGLPIYLVSF